MIKCICYDTIDLFHENSMALKRVFVCGDDRGGVFHHLAICDTSFHTATLRIKGKDFPKTVGGLQSHY